MTTMTSYAHGVPSWLDLATPDPEAAKSFYGDLFGWTYRDEATDRPGIHYTMARSQGRTSAGMMLLSEQMQASGMPPCWSTYVTVDDLEATLATVEPAGGAIAQPAMDVMDAGRMAVIVDPSGASLCLWEARNHPGAEVVNEHGAFSWAELTTPDPAAVSDFYAAVLGWRAQPAPMPGVEYTLFHVDGADPNGIAGAMAPPAEGLPASWGVYFTVDDVGATVARASELGADVLLAPTAMPGVGTLATLRDPQGAAFSLMEPGASGTGEAEGFDPASLPTVPASDPQLPGTTELGAFSLSLTVRDLEASRDFYTRLGFEVVGGVAEEGWLILKNGESTLGLFHGMFERNLLTFNPGLTNRMERLERFTDLRELQAQLEAAGLELDTRADPDGEGPASLTLTDPDGNPILLDQFF